MLALSSLFSLLDLPFPIPSRCVCGYEVGGYVYVCVFKVHVCALAAGGLWFFAGECFQSVGSETCFGYILMGHTPGPFVFDTLNQIRTHARARMYTHTVQSHLFFFCRISTHKSAPSLKQRA